MDSGFTKQCILDTETDIGRIYGDANRHLSEVCKQNKATETLFNVEAKHNAFGKEYKKDVQPPHYDMGGVPFHVVNRDMLLFGCFCYSRRYFLHFFTAAIDRNTFVSDQRDDVAAIPANIEFLFLEIAPFRSKHVPSR